MDRLIGSEEVSLMSGGVAIHVGYLGLKSNRIVTPLSLISIEFWS